jgi:two-component system OmpR family response regulator
MRILLIEDDAATAAYLAKGLREVSHVVEHANDGRDGLFRATEERFDLIVADRNLPRMDGLTIVRVLRENGDTTPVLVLSALGTVDDRVAGLKAGGDDYLTKPFAFSEFAARVEALLRRPRTAAAAAALQVADLVLDPAKRRATRGGRTLDLTAKEFELLEYLMRNADRVVTRTMLLEHVWHLHFDPQSNVIDVHVSRLRQALDANGAAPLIHTVRGAGYVLRAHA